MQKKKASRNDLWQGMITERVNNLVKTTGDLKNVVEKGFENVGVKVDGVKKSVDMKFAGHNEYHRKIEGKYFKWFLVLGSLIVGSLLANPESAKFVYSLLKLFIGIF